MFLRSLQLRRLLSFGPESPEIMLGPLNLIIGPNGSGKSNLIDAISLLQAAPRELVEEIREGGGTGAWIWKGDRDGKAEITVNLAFDESRRALQHHLEFVEKSFRLEIVDERVETVWPGQGLDERQPAFGHERRGPAFYTNNNPSEPRYERLDAQKSVLAQRKDPKQYPELWSLSEAYGAIRVYRAWTFGRHAPPRHYQPADLPTAHLSEDASNLALVLNGFRLDGDAHQGVLDSLRQLYDGVVDFHVQVQGGMVQLFLDEGGKRTIPAIRLSDGTLRWLSLLAVLLDPDPPWLVCIEEPELGLHPDMIPELARLLWVASSRMQLVVTTHSSSLIDAFSGSPEVVQVCERKEGSTSIQRLDGDSLTEWLKHYTLGELWSRGQIGGTRW